MIGKVVPGGPADNAGVKVGDHIQAINGVAIATWYDFVLSVRDAAGRKLQLDLDRDGQIVVVDLIPDLISERGRQVGKVGVAVAETAESRRELRTFVSYGFFEAGGKAFFETWDKSVFSLVMMGKMLTGEVSSLWPWSASASVFSICCPFRFWMGGICCIMLSKSSGAVRCRSGQWN